LPLGAILNVGFESEKWRKSEVLAIHAQTFVCECLAARMASARYADNLLACLPSARRGK
jgi:hypothetical protein